MNSLDKISNNINNPVLQNSIKIVPSLPVTPSPIIPLVDSRMLLHVAADFIGRDTGLNGNTSILTSEYLEFSLRKIKEIEQDPKKVEKLDFFIDVVKNYCEYSRKLSAMLHLKDTKKALIDLTKFNQDLIEKIKNAAPGERIFIPGGWHSAIGHAITHVIEKVEGSPATYKFYTFNTGDGIDLFHLKQQDSEGMLRYVTCHCVENIEEKNLCNPVFFQSLLESLVVPYGFNEGGREPHTLYDSIIPLLKGQRVDTIPEWATHFHQVQRSGTCSWKCLMAYLKSELSLSDYKTYAFLIKYYTLETFLNSNPLDSQKNQDLVLVANIAQKLIRSLNKPGIQIPEEEQQAFVKRLIEIKDCAREIRSKNRELAENQEPVKFESFDAVPAQLPFGCLPGERIDSSTDVLSSPAENIQFTPLNPIIQKKKLTRKNVCEQLKEWGDYCEVLYKKGNYLAARDFINKCLMSLPSTTLVPKKDPFWNAGENRLVSGLHKITDKLSAQKHTNFILTASDKEHEQIILHLSKLSDILYRCAFQLHSCCGEDIYSIIHTFAIQTQLMSGLSRCSSKSFISLEGKNPYATESFYSLQKLIEFNVFSHNDDLKKQVEFLRTHTRQGSPIFHYLTNCNCNKEDTFSVFLYLFLREKAREYNREYNIDENCQFHQLVTSDFGQRGLLPPFLAAINKQSFLVYLFTNPANFKTSGSSLQFQDCDLYDICFPTIDEISKNNAYEFIPLATINGVGVIPKKKESYQTSWLETEINDPAIREIINLGIKNKENGNAFVTPSIIEDPRVASIPFEERRELIKLSTTPPQMIIWQTLSYFSQHWDRLEDQNYQALFNLLITNQLQEEINRNPENLKVLLTFINQGLQQFSAPERLNGYLFCIDFGLKVYSKLSGLSPEQREAFSRAFSRWEDELTMLLNKPEYTFEQKQTVQVLLANFALMHPYNKEQAAQILLAISCQGAVPMPRFLQNDMLQRIFLNYLQDNYTAFMKELSENSEFRDRVMNWVSAYTFTFDLVDFDVNWDHISGPCFANKSRTMIVNILSGEAKCQNLKKTSLPQAIVSTPHYQELFGKVTLSADVENFNVYTFSRKGLPYRIEWNTSSDEKCMNIEVQMDGVWYRHIPRKLIKEQTKLPLPLIGQYSHWVSIGFPNQLLINDSSMKTLYRADITDKNTIGNLRAEEDLNLSLTLSIPSKLMSFEEKENILCWGDSSANLKRIDIPRYNLHFDIQQKGGAENKAYCQEHPGFYLKSNQQLPSLPFLNHFLILENGRGERKLLIPRCKMNLVKSSVPLDPQAEADRNSPHSYLSITLDAKLEPKSLSGEQALYLSYLAIVNQDFMAAKHYLDIFSKADAKGDLIFIFDCIFCWVTGENAKDPITEALGIRAIELVYEKIQFSKPDINHVDLDTFTSKMDSLFDRYLHNRNNTGIFRLSDEDEKRVLQRLFAHTTLNKPLSERNFARLIRLQSGASLEPVIFLPKDQKLDIFNNHTQEQYWDAARSQVFEYFEDCKKPWGGPGAIGKELLTRPRKSFVLFFIDCCLNIDTWQKEPKRSEALERLMLVRHIQLKGIALLRDCLQAIFAHPEFFAKELKNLHDIKKMYFLGDLNEWFFKIISAYRRSLIEFPQSEEQEVIDELLPVALSPNLKVKEHLELMPAQPFSLLNAIKVEDFFDAHAEVKAGRIPPLTLSSSPIANAYIVKMNQQLDDFYANREKNPVVSHTLNRINISPNGLSQLLDEEDKLFSVQLRQQKQYILELAHTEAKGERKFLEEKRKAGGQSSDITMDELISLFFKGDVESYLKQCPGLDAAGVQELSNLIFSYLQDTTHRQQLRRSQGILDEIIILENFIREGIQISGYYYPSEEDAFLLIRDLEERLAKEMMAKPAYEFHEEPEYLAIEYFSNIRLRPRQIHTLNLIFSGKDVSFEELKELIVELTMGSGKTKVLLPLLAMKMADGKKLVAIIVLPSLLEVNKHDQAETTLRVSGQRPFILNFHRNSSIDPRQLRFILHSLQNTVVDRHYIMATPSSFKCLRIVYKNLMIDEKNGFDGSKERREQIKLLKDILNLFKSNGVAILDEADKILESRRSEVNFPIGSPKKISPERKMVHRDLLEILLHPPCRDWVKLLENKQRDTRVETVAEIKKVFTDKILEKYTVKGDDIEELRQYFLREDSVIPNLEGHPHEDILKQAKEMISSMLPLMLKKTGNENFGRSLVSKKRYAIPYVANNTPDERGEFGQVDETMLYSAFTYIQEGLRPYDVDYLINELVRKVHKEARASHCTFEKTEAHDICVKRFGIKNIFNVKEEDRQRAAKSVRNDFETLMYWMNNFVYADIKIHNEKISANSLDLVDMFSHVCGFTGTARNRRNHPRRLQHPEIEKLIDHPEDDIAILDAIWRNVEGERGSSGIHVVDAATPVQYLEAVMAVPNVVCLLDTGALIKGISNKDAAENIQKLIDKSSPLKGTLFFDENNSIVVHLDGCGPVALDTVAIHERFSYYDQAHTTGIDVKQSPQAKAVLTFSYNTIRDMTQGSMRMRQLLTSNAIELLIPKPVAEKIHVEGKPLFIDVLKAGLVRQAEDLGDDLECFIRQDLSHIISEKVLDLILSLESIEEGVEVIRIFEPVLIDTTTDKPSFKVMKPTLEILEKLRIHKIAETNVLCSKAQGLSESLQEKIETVRSEAERELNEYIMPEKEALPEKRLDNIGSLELGCQLEIEREIEVNEESQKVQLKQASYNIWNCWTGIACYKPDFLAVKSPYQYAPKVITLGDVFQSSDSLRKFDGIFNPHLRTTRNFVISVANQTEWAFVPNAQKKCTQLVFYKEEGNVIALMVDPVEAAWLREVLPVERQNKYIKKMNVSEKSYPHQAYFLDIENNFFEAIGAPFTQEEKQRMVELTAQVKFYNGELVYSEDEWKYLEAWVVASGNIPLMRELFEKSLNSQPGQFKFYLQTPLHQMLNGNQ